MERRIDFTSWDRGDRRRLLEREWLVANGLGGYCSSTVLGTLTRRYHGLLVAALPAPLGRQMTLAFVEERIITKPEVPPVDLSTLEKPSCPLDLTCADYLKAFTLEDGLPNWHYQVGECGIHKSLFMPHEQNSVHVSWLLADGPRVNVVLRIAPFVHFRSHGSEVHDGRPGPYEIEGYPEVEGGFVCQPCGEARDGNGSPVLRLFIRGAQATFRSSPRAEEVEYSVEKARGYPAVGTLWNPGFFEVTLPASEPLTLIASTEDWTTLHALSPRESLAAERGRRKALVESAARRIDHPLVSELILAADQFLMIPAARPADLALAHSSGQDRRSVVAGYHWFTDWGRDTMIGLEGLCLIPKRFEIAQAVLATFAGHVKNGLIPNLFPEGDIEGVYNTADATLWFVHALDRYVAYSGDREFALSLLPVLREIVDRHMRGTSFGIGIDPGDGLLAEGSEGYALTWMDAKLDDWVVTPRRGKPVEINALWYNALEVCAGFLSDVGDVEAAAAVAAAAERTRRSFNERFWYEEGGYLFDVVDGPAADDSSCRPNQLLAISLPNPVLDGIRWRPVVETVRERLLTPFGLRTLAPGCPDYQETYQGDLRARDAAYHQGTVWPWLIGPFVDAWLKVHPEDRDGARGFLTAFDDHLSEAGIGSVSEILDASPPFVPRGCIAQAWSVAEVLRSWVKTSADQAGTSV